MRLDSGSIWIRILFGSNQIWFDMIRFHSFPFDWVDPNRFDSIQIHFDSIGFGCDLIRFRSKWSFAKLCVLNVLMFEEHEWCKSAEPLQFPRKSVGDSETERPGLLVTLSVRFLCISLSSTMTTVSQTSLGYIEIGTARLSEVPLCLYASLFAEMSKVLPFISARRLACSSWVLVQFH